MFSVAATVLGFGLFSSKIITKGTIVPLRVESKIIELLSGCEQIALILSGNDPSRTCLIMLIVDSSLFTISSHEVAVK